MMLQPIRIGFSRHTGFSHTHVIGNDTAILQRQGRDAMAIEIPPGRIAMQQDHWLSVPYVHVVHLTVTGVQIVRSERKGIVQGIVLEFKHIPENLLARRFSSF
jgi:hypothetical protein